MTSLDDRIGSSPDSETETAAEAVESDTTGTLTEVTVRDRLRRIAAWFRSVSNIYLVIALPAGLAFAFLVPPTQVLDESAHFLRVWEISKGHVIADVATDPNSGQKSNAATTDVCPREYAQQFMNAAAQPEPFDLNDFWYNTPNCSPERTATFVGEAMGSYSVWTYPGQSAGVAVGRLLHLPLPFVFYLGRLGGLALAISMCWYAIRIAPRAKLALAFVALLPMSLMTAAAYSPDAMVLGASLIIIANCLRFALTAAPPRRIDFVILGIAYTALVLSKPPYIVFGLLFLCYPATLFGTRRRTVGRLATLVAIPLVLTAIWNRVGFPQGAIEVFRPGIDQAGQVKWIIKHPFGYLESIYDTFFNWVQQEFMLKGWVGVFGMLRSGSADSPLMLPFFVLVASGGLAYVTAAEAGPRIIGRSREAALRSWVPLATFVLGALALFTSAHVAWDPVGPGEIYGVQGRYFIPFLALPAVGFALRHEKRETSIGVIAIVVVAAALLVGSFVKMAFYFY